MSLVECIPNVSEGRRPEVIRACAAAVTGAGAMLLDQSSDADHNRSVFTFAGREAEVRAAVHALVDVAVRAIDMRSHTGVAETMFRALSEKGINIQVISTSEIKISVLIDEAYTELAVRALHAAYGLDKIGA